MCIGSIVLSNDTDRIVVAPITDLLQIIKKLADDPLKEPIEPVFTKEDLLENNSSIKTVVLQKTIFRIGRLL